MSPSNLGSVGLSGVSVLKPTISSPEMNASG